MRPHSHFNKYLLTTLAAIISFSVCAQCHDRGERNHNCQARNKFTATDRLKNYPFGSATEVRLVSFDNAPDGVLEHRLPETHGKVDISKLTEQTSLTKNQIDSLTYILFNIGYRGRILTLEAYGCYNPRNAILFIDSAGEAFEYMEICFECNGFRLSSEKIETGDFCSQKYEILKDFFIRRGIEIGTVKEIRVR